MKREAEQTWAAERVENALLRERINDVAAEVARLTVALEGPDSPIEAILAGEQLAAQQRPARSAGTAAAKARATSPTASAPCRCGLAASAPTDLIPGIAPPGAASP